MNNDLELNEAVLNTWLRFEGIMRMTVINGSLTHREFSVCNMLDQSDKPLTATDLCEKLAVDKSQMNRTLNKLEEYGLVVRERSPMDKRRVYVKLNTQNAERYEQMHERALEYTDAVITKLGSDDFDYIRKAFIAVIDALEETISSENRKD